MREHGELFRDQYESRFVCSIIGGAPGGMGGPGKGNPNSQGGSGGTGQGGRGRPRGPGASIAASTNPGGITGNPNASQSGRGGGSFTSPTGQTRDQMQAQDQIGANVANAQNDFNDVDNDFGEDLGNLMASFVGINEMDPTRPGFSQPGAPGQTGSADWGFDPAGAIGGALGTAFGVPFVGGFLADQISSAFGRPMEVNLGPSVFDNEDGSTTHTGGSMTVHRDDDKNTMYGTSPMLAGVGQGVANVAPSSATFSGVDPSTPDPAPTPAAPTEDLPDGLSPTELPSGVVVDPGNTGLDPNSLASIFQKYGTRSYKGKSKAPASALV